MAIAKEQEIFRSYDGKGTISFDFGLSLDSEFKVIEKPDGRIRIFLTTYLSPANARVMQENEKRIPHANLVGSVRTPNGKLDAQDLYLDKIHIRGEKNKPVFMNLEFVVFSPVRIEYSELHQSDEVKVHFFLTNFLFNGCDWSIIGNERIRDKFTVRLDEKDITFRQIENYKEISTRLQETRGIAPTSYASTSFSFAEMNENNELVFDLTNLLSLATGTYVGVICKDVIKEGALAATFLLPYKTFSLNKSDPLIDPRNLSNCDLKKFLEITYPQYYNQKDELGLDVVIEYYVYMKLMRIMQVKYLLSAITFECLTSYLSDYFKRRKKVAKLNSFKNKLKALFSEFRVKFNEEELNFVGIRDKIVHTGRFPTGTDSSVECRKLIHLLDRTLLTILRYKGNPFLNIKQGYKREILE